ncbi:putative Rho GTPase-activating protein syd-1 [Trichinella spiralis]|nr:putative Rho GTPase-activating protein syd-1 [Trichinella spiralis]
MPSFSIAKCFISSISFHIHLLLYIGRKQFSKHEKVLNI